MSALSPSQKHTVLFSIYQNNTWTIRSLVDETIYPVTQRIILKIVGFYETPQVASLQSAASGGGNMEVCRIISILTHFFFLACFMFMFLEALHVYAMVASVVHKDGMFTKLQNIVLGWGISSAFILITIAAHYTDYGGHYHCWLQMDTE